MASDRDILAKLITQEFDFHYSIDSDNCEPIEAGIKAGCAAALAKGWRPPARTVADPAAIDPLDLLTVTIADAEREPGESGDGATGREVAASILAKGWRPPAREITDYAEFTNLPVGTVVMGTDTRTVWQRVTDGWLWVGHNIPAYHYEVFRDDKSVTVLYDPTCPHDSRSGTADGRWRCDQCGTDCGPNTYLTQEGGRG